MMDLLENLATGMAALKAGNYEVQIPVTADGQMGLLQQSFNDLAHFIRESKQEKIEYERALAEDNRAWMEKLDAAFEETNALKQQQDGDYFLTSLLTTPLASNKSESRHLHIETLLEQKKKFEFRNWQKDLGGDTCITSTITLKDRRFTVFLNADAMGKSMQGAGGILVLGSVFHAVLERTRLSPHAQDVFPEHWLKYTFTELHRVFEVFDGSMLVSLVIGLVDDDSGLMYYINAEHPPLVLYRNGKAKYIEDTVYLRKLGTLGVTGPIGVSVFSLRPGDVIVAGSDGRDDLLLGHDDEGKRIFNADYSLFLRIVEEAQGQIAAIRETLLRHGELTDDLSLMRLAFSGTSARTRSRPALVQEQIRTFIKDRQYAEAARLADEYLLLNPASSAFLYISSYCHKKRGDLRSAADSGERLLLRNRGFVRNLINLAEIYYLQGNRERCRLLARDAERFDPQNSRAQQILKAIAA